ncbi:MAG: hypothetical protein ACM3MA_01955 [Acidobacteriota bacterium]
MSFLLKLPYMFRSYVNRDEKHVAKFFQRVHEKDSEYAVRDGLVRLVQQNAAALNLWAEYRYKGYKYLSKPARRRMYENLARIQELFEQHCAAHPLAPEAVAQHVGQVRTDTGLALQEPDKLVFLAQIMDFLRPAHGRYVYRASSSFGRLLQSPDDTTLEGDCNQIVTLYIYLYSTRYDVSELRLVSLPGHVALHFRGVDVEATNASFTFHDKPERRVVPVQEIVSINLLDTSDSYFKQHKIPAETFLQAARLAYMISSERELVRKNLKAAYNNAVKELLEHKKFKTALVYARQAEDGALVELVGHNGAVYFMKKNQFASARSYAAHTRRSAELNKTISHNEGVFYYKAGKFHEAVRAFQRNNDHTMVQRCYEGLFFREQKLIAGAKTVDQLQSHRATIYRMRDYAQKSGNFKLISHVNELIRHL